MYQNNIITLECHGSNNYLILPSYYDKMLLYISARFVTILVILKSYNFFRYCRLVGCQKLAQKRENVFVSDFFLKHINTKILALKTVFVYTIMMVQNENVITIQ